ncbi:hypothetical protein XENOCAPTIV_025474 [Xenoophorus captivus]|uniref:Uncharacterized protein n=1 Tax=Xenoophorus captivus TaxID=1517983 RepID=A0ABV0SBF9_9TELE
MTHIEPGIQEDAMNVLDIFLEHYPSLLASRPAVLLTNFLELISHRQSSGGPRKAQDARGRTWTLSVHPDRSMTSQQLGNFLQAVVEERPTEEGDLSVRTEGSFAGTLVPLLLEVWVEACAGDCTWNTTEGAYLLTPDAMSVMFQVLSILQLLRKLPTQRENLDALMLILCKWRLFSTGLGVYCLRRYLIVFPRSSLSGWSAGSQEAALQDVDYISFLFSTLTGFSSEHLSALQEDETALLPSPLSPLCLYQTPLEQFTHHWDIVEVRTLLSQSPSCT